MARNSFMDEATVADGVYTEFDFDSSMTGLHIINTGDADVIFSFNQEEEDGKVLASEYSQTRDNIDESKVYIKGDGGEADVRVEAWRRPS